MITLAHQPPNLREIALTTVEPFLHYAAYLLLASGLMFAFFQIYTWLTPYDEVALIRQGNTAAVLSLSGALIGFTLTLASSIMHTQSYVQFLIWAAAAASVQLLLFLAISALLKDTSSQIEGNNTAFGGLIGAISLAVGTINAACLS